MLQLQMELKREARKLRRRLTRQGKGPALGTPEKGRCRILSLKRGAFLLGPDRPKVPLLGWSIPDASLSSRARVETVEFGLILSGPERINPPSVKAMADNHFAPFSLDCPSRHHSTASMEPVQLTTAVMTIVNTLHIIVQFRQNQNLKNQARRRRKRSDESDEDMDTDFSKTMVPSNLEIMVLMGQAHAKER
ncbi:hypothetical protein UY3_16145 [Chelonia mydas]|uniref:Uncharacterized protein n=1 Tax=Chelonia mydas TaxID=8469 RepID=M7AUT6_CHEMY|nr:hypothetical protein UY3_16145 [Chelonia mydas]